MKISNPETGLLIEKDGVAFKKLIKMGFKEENNTLIPKDPDNYIKLLNYYINPKIYHTLNKNKSVFPDTGKELQYKTMFKTEERRDNFNIVFNNEEKTFKIIPNDKSNYEKTTENNWLKKDTPAYRLADADGLLLKKMVYAPNKMMIPVNSFQYNELINDGYLYDEKENLLVYPTIHTFEKEVSYPIGHNDISSEHLDGITTLTLEYDDALIEINIKKAVFNINKYLFYAETKSGILRGINGGNHVKFGIAFGESNDTKQPDNCLISELETHCLKTHKYIEKQKVIQDLHIKYKNGVSGGYNYEYISKKLGLKIVVKYPPYGEDDKIIFGNHRETRAMFVCNYFNNHIQHELIENKNKEEITYDTLTWDLIKEEPNKIVNIIGNMKEPIMVVTIDKVYKTKYVEFNEEKLDLDGNLSIIGYFTSLFIKTNPKIKSLNLTNHNMSAIKSICQHGIMFSKQNVEDATKKYHHYDIKSAYTTYAKCKYYTGIPTDLTYCINMKNYTDIDEIKKIVYKYEGFIYVKMICIWTNKPIYRWVSCPYVRHYFENRTDEIDILYIMISRDVIDLNIDNLNVSKRMWHYVLGNINKTKSSPSYITTDPILAKTTTGTTEEEVIKGLKVYRKKQHGDASVLTNYFPHISGYVQNYTEIRIEMFVIKNKIPIDSIQRIWVDGIYTTHKCSQVLDENIDNDFHSSEIPMPVNDEVGINYNAAEPEYFSFNFEERLINGDNIIVKGAGGTGKTHLCKNLYNQTPNSIILVPTNELKKQYTGCKCHTIDKVIHSPTNEFYRYTTYLIDEYSMIPQEKIDKLKDRYRPQNTILFGDVEQLGIIKMYDDNDNLITHEINEKDYNIQILVKNYRQFNVKFQKKLNKLRLTGEFKFNKTVDPKTAINEKFTILTSTHKIIDKMNSLGLMLNENVYIDGLKVNSPMRFYKTKKDCFNAGEFGTIIDIKDNMLTILKEDNITVYLKVDTFKKYHKLNYASSFHAYQGKTILNNIAVDTKRHFVPNMLYVACSRPINEKQLHELVA
jgi:hypothetical protein